ncbi:NUDIX hydrolase [Veillonella sp. VA139]|uniref:NUDIX hydrolase n=1 Tax=Veillonella sp. VA139 TaxID=741830 RepID=UPI000F8EB1C2|nr:NUDIX hydrolase [Veillonella sp. VA139]
MQERKLSSEMKFDGKLIKVTYDIADVNGKEAWREVVHHPGASAVVAIDEDNRIIMEKQFRYALNDYLLEIPAGKLDAGEDPLVCAKRELEEETGIIASEWISLGTIATSPGFCNEVIHLYVAKGLSKGEIHWDEDEYVEVERYTFDELLQRIQDEKIKDSKTLSALLLAMPYIQ